MDGTSSNQRQISDHPLLMLTQLVGSALVNIIADGGDTAELAGRVEEFVRWLKS